MTKTRYRSHGCDASFILALIASTFLMGSSFIAGKILLRQGFSALFLVGRRGAFSWRYSPPFLWRKIVKP
jgi:hypothetical protein